ncbi:MAG: dipeptide epimerase [Ignavibacteriae bacterium]|nr:dipeptide epimerase [Ignavibacteriota bacterium]MCB0746149.1 dipeptide epimerase [Ignavibacteriota bacterium]
MKIASIETWSHKMKLSSPYTIAYETIDSTVNVFTKITTNKGTVGFGCAAPDLEVTDETEESVITSCNDIIEPLLKGSDALRYSYQLNKLSEPLKKHPSAMAMIDMALFDIMGKEANMPIYKMLGGFREKMKTSITIGILPINDTVQNAKEYIKQGFSILKIKGGADVDEDVERMKKVREAVGKNVQLRFDANQGYSVYESLKFVEETRDVKIELLEQPTSKQEPDLLGRVTNNVPIIVMADESLMNLVDAFKLARRDLVDTVNIKLMKVGGIDEAIKINAVAKAANLEVMVGCMDESALGIAAGLHFALSKPNVTYADLDGHLDLIDDPAKGAVILKNGTLYPTNKPGLGFNL